MDASSLQTRKLAPRLLTFSATAVSFRRHVGCDVCNTRERGSNELPLSRRGILAVDAVHIPLNEACWHGEPYVPSADAGANYQNAVKAYVSLLNTNGIVAVMDLQWTDGQHTGPSSGCSSSQATCLKPMPDAAQAIPFWISVANTFKGNNTTGRRTRLPRAGTVAVVGHPPAMAFACAARSLARAAVVLDGSAFHITRSPS